LKLCCCVNWGFCTPFWRPNRQKDFLVVAFNWHQNHQTFVQLQPFICPVIIMSIQNLSTILCIVLLFCNVDVQFFFQIISNTFPQAKSLQMNILC
jgi:hypothetical protein